MTEDIVEFGATTPRPRQASRRSRPWWLANRMLPVAGLGAVAGAVSLVLPWQTLVILPGQGDIAPSNQNTYQAMLISLGAHGSGYLLTLIATVAAAALVFYGHQGIHRAARVLGGAFSFANLVLLAATAYALTKGTSVNSLPFFIISPEDRDRMALDPDLGFYAGVVAVLALAVAVLGARRVTPPAEGEQPGAGTGDGPETGDGEPDDGVIDLSVSVHPVGKQVAAG